MDYKRNIPLSVPNLTLDILDNIKETIETGWVSTGGRFINEFEQSIADYLGVEAAVSCQSGTAGLHLGLISQDIGLDDEVIVPTLTFIAAVNPVKYVGANPIFMDCDDSLNMDIDKLTNFIENECNYTNNKLINKQTNRHIKAIVIVHVFGNPIDIDRIIYICNKYNLKLIEDSTEALGSKYKGRYCGTFGDVGVFSFNANKIITTGGGGMVIARDKNTLDYIKYLSIQAKDDQLFFKHNEIGYNYRMTNIQGAFGISQLKLLPSFINTKEYNYMLYKRLLKEIDGLTLLSFNENCDPNYWFYSIFVDEKRYGLSRNELMFELEKLGIQTRPLWSLIHCQKPYINSQTYNIEKAYIYEQNILNLPCSTNLLEKDIEYICSCLQTIKNRKLVTI